MTFNIASGTEISMRELARMIVEITGGHPEIIYNPRNTGGLARLCGDITLAREKLGYQPRIALPEGLKLTMEYELEPRPTDQKDEE
ncbi:MAG TPA: hypothetical protein DDW19_02055 [Anaerolineaceae bacterium]|nr:hypothetical protein [Anaerolineaceae bacterium]